MPLYVISILNAKTNLTTMGLDSYNESWISISNCKNKSWFVLSIFNPNHSSTPIIHWSTSLDNPNHSRLHINVTIHIIHPPKSLDHPNYSPLHINVTIQIIHPFISLDHPNHSPLHINVTIQIIPPPIHIKGWGHFHKTLYGIFLVTFVKDVVWVIALKVKSFRRTVTNNWLKKWCINDSGFSFPPKSIYWITLTRRYMCLKTHP